MDPVEFLSTLDESEVIALGGQIADEFVSSSIIAVAIGDRIAHDRSLYLYRLANLLHNYMIEERGMRTAARALFDRLNSAVESITGTPIMAPGEYEEKYN